MSLKVEINVKMREHICKKIGSEIVIGWMAKKTNRPNATCLKICRRSSRHTKIINSHWKESLWLEFKLNTNKQRLSQRAETKHKQQKHNIFIPNGNQPTMTIYHNTNIQTLCTDMPIFTYCSKRCSFLKCFDKNDFQFFQIKIIDFFPFPLFQNAEICSYSQTWITQNCKRPKYHFSYQMKFKLIITESCFGPNLTPITAVTHFHAFGLFSQSRTFTHLPFPRSNAF